MIASSLSAAVQSPLDSDFMLHALNHQGQQLSQEQAQQLSNQLLELHFGSVLLLTSQNKIIYASQELCELFKGGESTGLKHPLPPEIEAIGQILQRCREQFASQNWMLDFNIVIKTAIALRIRSRWLQLDGFKDPCILLIVENFQQLVQETALNAAQTWGLTAREQEVWLLHREGYTYSKVAEQLMISKNTVKKHMSSIHAKRRAAMAS